MRRPSRRMGGAGHPHAGGENTTAASSPYRAFGPSPRGWGKLFRKMHSTPRTRAIPTRVGKTLPAVLVRLFMAGHPHAGGENVVWQTRRCFLFGPSPRGWGKPARNRGGGKESRAIPTRVGKTKRNAWMNRANAGHPHAGGENRAVFGASAHDIGPSPRGWGKHRENRPYSRRNRAIPTRVGKTGRCLSLRRQLPGHPHAGGENASELTGPATQRGPSPRGWGKRFFGSFKSRSGRAIPTRVGKTVMVRAGSASLAGHPHAGGENLPRFMNQCVAIGPSPRGWGKLTRTCFLRRAPRAIPTRVGKTV